MTEISAVLVKKLRDATNVSMMECKKALLEANGDMEKANKILREKGIATALKKSSRTANQGLMVSASSSDEKTVSLIEVNCETDFVARNEDFISFTNELAVKALSTEGMLAEIVKDEVTAKIAKIGENIIVKRNVRYVLQGMGMIGKYIHLGGKVGVLVEVGCTKSETLSNQAFKDLVKDLTLHIAAAYPRYLEPKDVPQAELQSEREIYAKQVVDKPANIVEKIVDGKIKKFYGDVCLVEQLFVKEQKETIKQLLASVGKTVGDTLTIKRFVRYQLGETN